MQRLHGWYIVLLGLMLAAPVQAGQFYVEAGLYGRASDDATYVDKTGRDVGNHGWGKLEAGYQHTVGRHWYVGAEAFHLSVITTNEDEGWEYIGGKVGARW